VKTLCGKTLSEIAIERLREFEQAAIGKHPDGYYLAYSGGKDSDVLLHLTRASGVKFTAHHNLTTCDPPELIYHVRKQPEVIIEKPKITMWKLIRKRGLPPRRNARFCCSELKERGGAGRIVLTGVRWSESTRRQSRRMFEACYRDKSKHYLQPIIDWSSADVWEYIRTNNIEYCSLYDEGFKRIGCVLCPMSRNTERDILRWPKIAKAWEKAVKATYKPGISKAFTSPDDYWEWWLDRDRPTISDEGYVLFEDDPSLIEANK